MDFLTASGAHPARRVALSIVPRTIAACLAALVCGASNAATHIVQQQSFEQPSDGTNYVTFNESGIGDSGTDDYFKRGVPADFHMIQNLVGSDGSYFYGAEDTDGQGLTQACSLTLPAADARGFANLEVAWLVAAARDDAGTTGLRYENDDFMTLQARVDDGPWTTLSDFRGANADPFQSDLLKEDTNGDGVGDGTTATHNFLNVQRALPADGTNVQVRVLVWMRGGDEEVGFDNLRVLGDPILPVIAITMPVSDVVVSATLTATNLSGTANLGVLGAIAWTNSGTGASGTLPAATSWSLPGLALAEGVNTITVTGSNTVGNVTNAVRVISRVSLPRLDITSPAEGLLVSDLIATVPVSGTANDVVVGTIRWTNTWNGAAGTVSAGTAWAIPAVPLSTGTNVVTVIGSDSHGQSTNDTVRAYRLPPPFVDIASPANGLLVAHDVLTANVSGTAATEMTGVLRWTNSLTGDAGAIAASANWQILNVPLDLGTNVISVSGTNVLGRPASDSVSVYKVPAPVVAITAPAAFLAVSDLATTIPIFGTANGVVSGLAWSNSLTGATGQQAASANWQISGILLGLGTNVVTVAGSNVVGRTSSAAVSIYRVPAPVIAVTSPASTTVVPNSQASVTLNGTASGEVSGQLCWTNAFNGAAGVIAAQANWSIPGVPLAPGVNPIFVKASNEVGRITQTSVDVSREGTVLLNEVLVNPNGDDALTHLEYIELLDTTLATPAGDLSLLLLDGASAFAGNVLHRWDLTGLAFGKNGLLLIGDGYGGPPPVGAWSNVVSPHTVGGDAGFVAQSLNNTSVSLLLARNCTAGAFEGADLDTNDDGVLDATPWSELVDSIGWTDGDGGDRAYGPARVIPVTAAFEAPDALTRFPSNRVPFDITAWYYGEMITNGGADPMERGYRDDGGADGASANLPDGAEVTPGRPNYPDPYDRDGDRIADAWEQIHFGGPTNANPNADSDSDGFNDRDEFWAGTDPTNDASYFSIVSLGSTGTYVNVLVTVTNDGPPHVVTQGVLWVESLLLRWPSRSNRCYQVFSADSVDGAPTLLDGMVPSAPPMNTYTGETVDVEIRFYRIGVLEPVFFW